MVAILFRLQHVGWLFYTYYKHNGLVNTATTVQDVYQLSACLDNSLDLIVTLHNIFWTEMCFLTLLVGTRLRQNTITCMQLGPLLLRCVNFNLRMDR